MCWNALKQYTLKKKEAFSPWKIIALDHVPIMCWNALKQYTLKKKEA
jgi:hypothetical protein